MSPVTVYTKPECPQCHGTVRYLKKYEIPYKLVDITEDDKGRAKAYELGYTSVPVVVAGDRHWSGFHPDLIAGLVAQEEAVSA